MQGYVIVHSIFASHSVNNLVGSYHLSRHQAVGGVDLTRSQSTDFFCQQTLVVRSRLILSDDDTSSISMAMTMGSCFNLLTTLSLMALDRYGFLGYC